MSQDANPEEIAKQEKIRQALGDILAAKEEASTHGERFKQEIPPSEINHRFTDEVVCPHCGHEHSDSWDFFSDSNTIEIECDRCEKEFGCERDFTTTYNTWKP